MIDTYWKNTLHCVISLGVSKEVTFASFSSTSSFDDMVPVDDVLVILLISPIKKKINKVSYQCNSYFMYDNKQTVLNCIIKYYNKVWILNESKTKIIIFLILNTVHVQV